MFFVHYKITFYHKQYLPTRGLKCFCSIIKIVFIFVLVEVNMITTIALHLIGFLFEVVYPLLFDKIKTKRINAITMAWIACNVGVLL